MLAAAKIAGYPPAVAGAPRPIAQACVTPDIAVNEEPVLVEWKRPASDDTQMSPVTLGLTTILTGEVDLPREPATAKVLPPSVDR